MRLSSSLWVCSLASLLCLLQLPHAKTSPLPSIAGAPFHSDVVQNLFPLLQSKKFQDIPDLTVTLERNVSQPGLHRSLLTKIEWSRPLSKDCRLALVETLPEYMYVDLDEDKEMERFGGPVVSALFPIDVEKPTSASPSHTVVVHQPAADGERVSYVPLPIHFRYQTASEDLQYIPVKVLDPLVFVKCSKSTSDTWKHVATVSVQQAPDQLIPVGFLPHYPMVTAGTLATTLLGIAYIMRHVLNHCQSETKKWR
eukprot:GILJ01007130.1.p1 GENE.GILJ01007130.1~~GILJ01007130.1.p1  ORF type:complete len:254 (+),score=27.28 GILJ01007130.1:51-812(+)